MGRQRAFRAQLEPLEARHLLSGAPPVSFGVVGDSLTAGNTFTVSWVPIMATHGPADFGPGNSYNVALGGATSSSIHSGGQVAAMQGLVSSGQVALPYIFIGGNDLLGVANQIASGSLNGMALTNTINAWVNNITSAADTFINAFPVGAPKDVVVVSFPDITACPAGLSLFDTPVEMARGQDAINQANAALLAAVKTRGLPFADIKGLQQAYGAGPLVVGGVTMNTTGTGSDPHFLFRDAIHPGLIGHELLANLMMAAANKGYGTSFDMITDQEMLQDAGLSAEYTGETLSIDYEQFVIVNSTVATRKLFYKDSPKWNVTNANMPGHSDDNAIAPDKTAYVANGAAATFANVSSYTRGINGLVIDLSGSHGAITASDFLFKVGNNNAPSTWATATAPTAVTTRLGAGVGGSDRVELLWADGAISNTWLEVVVRGNDTLGGSNTNTGLSASDVFFFGSAPGDSAAGDTSGFLVNSTDEQSARNDPHGVTNPATITNVNDFDRNGLVNGVDQNATRSFATSALTQLKFLTVGAGGPFAPQSLPTADGDAGIASALATSFTRATASTAAPPLAPLSTEPSSTATSAPRSAFFQSLDEDETVADELDSLAADDSIDAWLEQAA